MALSTMENSVLERIQSFFNESQYIDLTRNSTRYNSRILKDKSCREPYIDSQTGVQQNHCHLYLTNNDRMPGVLHGQVYSYPARRWKCHRRSYANEIENYAADSDEHTITTVENPAVLAVATTTGDIGLNDGQDSWGYYEENPYDELDDEDDLESDEDFDDETYNKKGKRKTGYVRKPRGQIRVRKRPLAKLSGSSTPTMQMHNSPSQANKVSRPIIKKAEIPDDPEHKPYICEYPPRATMSATNTPTPTFAKVPEKDKNEENYEPKVVEKTGISAPGVKKSVPASPYCDFCLGDHKMNKKSEKPEMLVSCADCGRSGHPTCLQFTENMMTSVILYRWQCIECKTCTLCGTSENDDQLLFCDDCDRGYHLYCLTPPLQSPPEGEWSCYLCIKEFHGGVAPGN